jgi:outer membrane protein OmpA-like peptidoglycan-associated protein
MHRGLLAFALVVGACGGSSAASSGTTTTNTAGGGGTSVAPPAPTDRCPLLLRCYQKVAEYRSCPEPTIQFKSNSTELTAESKATVDHLASEIKTLGRLKKLLIEGHHAPDEAQSLAESRALSIKTRLVDKGVHDALLEIHTERVRGGSNEVTLYVIDCSTEQAAKPTHGKSKAFWIILY